MHSLFINNFVYGIYIIMHVYIQYICDRHSKSKKFRCVFWLL